jgi:hypothetical protein
MKVGAHVVVLAGIGYAVVQLAEAREATNIFLWLIGAALVHDLVFVPAYTALDRLVRRLLPRPRVPVVNHVRFVAVVSGALLLVWFPLILGRATSNYERVTGRAPADYLGRWLAITAGLAVVSALAYAVRVQRLQHAVAAAPDEHAPRA